MRMNSSFPDYIFLYFATTQLMCCHVGFQMGRRAETPRGFYGAHGK